MIENDVFFKYSFPQCKRNILEYETRTFFIVFFVCICSKCSMYYTHSGPTIPFEDGELPQDTCRARGKADIRYSMDYHFEIRYSKDYHFENVLQVNLETFVVPVGDPDMKLEWFLRYKRE